MKAVKSNAKQTTNEVLFQKLGLTWYVFSEVKGEMIYSALPNGMDPRTTKLELIEVIQDHMEKVSNHYSRKAEISA